MGSTRVVLSRASAGLLGRRLTTSAPRARPCESLLRQFSNYQPWYTSSSEKMQPIPTYHPYPLTPTRTQPRNEPAREIPATSPIPEVHETRPPPQPAQPEAAAQPSANANPTILETEAQQLKPAPPKRKFKPRKAALKLTPSAVEHLRSLLDQPQPKLIKVGVRNRGCSGLSYHLEYVDKPGMFDEEVEQDGVKVVIDSKALFSIIGSEMDWIEDRLRQQFIFRNPNIKEECGCGESFMV
ncbi:iron-binding protein iscA [Durotheca rogersii]|uniref:iron-binding protein iscA n=1 Tax=Durotheca rogersii TaxID=419775 RepID=UPI00221F2F94|nr:iron-binding protein iscA [Durotheca rogersii]KAI5864093.1 iron-binding protein iscA [Durotheca rogersii]